MDQGILGHLIAIEKTQARLEEKLDVLAAQVERLCERVDAHAELIREHSTRLGDLRERTGALEVASKSHQTTLDRAAGARILLNGLMAMAGAVMALLGQYLWGR